MLERTVEQELVPMALEFGLGVTPWSPLKSGVVSGKYTGRTVGQIKTDRGPFVEMFLNENIYAVVDELEAIAGAHDSTPARVALAWVQQRRGAASTINGARRLSQLEDNLKALEVVLSAQERDELTAPALGFPQRMQPIFPAIHNGGTTMNGVYAPASTFGLQPGDQPY